MLSVKILAINLALSGAVASSGPSQIPEATDTVRMDSIIADSTKMQSEMPDSTFEPQSELNSLSDLDSDYLSAASDSSWWYRKIENKAFGVGEYLEFSVKYGMLPAGTAELKIPEIMDYQGKTCYRVVSIARSNDVISVFYRVRDSVETVIDYDGVFSRKFFKHLREGGYKTDKTTIFDQRRHLGITGNDSVPSYAFVQDPLSSLYYIRTQPLVPGSDIYVDNHTDKKNFPLKIIVYRRETVEVPAGKFDCVVIEPIMRAEGIFKAKGRIWIWLTDDQYKIPVMMKTEVFFLGSVSAQLKSYKLGITKGNYE